MTRPKVGDVVTVLTLKPLMGKSPHTVAVLGHFGYVEDAPTVRGGPSRYKVLKELPSAEEFAKLRDQRYTQTVANLVSDAFSVFEELSGELQEWYDNLPESFQQGDKGSALEEATSTLDNLQAPDVPESVQDLKAVFLPRLRVTSRSDRRDEATGMLTVAEEAILSYVNDKREEYDELEDGPTQEQEDDLTVAEEFAGELQNAAEEAEGVEFPGMYG